MKKNNVSDLFKDYSKKEDLISNIKERANNGLQNRMSAYAPKYKKPVQKQNASDLFKETRNQFQIREDNIKAEIERLQNSTKLNVTKEMLMSADECNRLEIANKLIKLSENNRYFMTVSKDLSKYKDSELKISKKGYYIETYEGEILHLNYDIDQITPVPVPVCCVINTNLNYDSYHLFKKHSSGSLVHVGIICFAN